MGAADPKHTPVSSGKKGDRPLDHTLKLKMAEDLPNQVLSKLAAADGTLLTSEAFPDLSFVTIKSAIDRLRSREFITAEQLDKIEVTLTKDGEDIAQKGSFGARVFQLVSQMGGLKIKDLPTKTGSATVAKFGQADCFKNKWVKKDGDSLTPLTDHIDDKVQKQLQEISQTKTLKDAAALKEFKKREYVSDRKVLDFRIAKGKNFSNEFVKEETDLTAEMLASGAWKTVKLKPYNFKAKGAPTPSGALHPLNKVREEFRDIFFEMGFEEMPTNRFVETGFWNFDALFVPQQHPARDLQDTFYISDPPRADPPRDDPIPPTPGSKELPATHKRTKSKSTEKTLDYTSWHWTRNP